MATARRQHGAYRQALEDAGVSTTVLDADEAHPDSPFVEDTAVIIGDTALLSRPGAPSRRGEVGPVAQVLAEQFRTAAVAPPATLDGGDVLVVGDRVFVGLSGRTNQEGAGTVIMTAAPRGYAVRQVRVHGVLHLKSAVTALDGETLLGDFTRLDAGDFAGLRLLAVPGGEERAANVVALGDGRVLVAAEFPATAELLVESGYEPLAVEASEFAKADGGLTCLSIRW